MSPTEIKKQLRNEMNEKLVALGHDAPRSTKRRKSANMGRFSQQGHSWNSEKYVRSEV